MFLCASNVAEELPSIDVGTLEIVCRLLCAMLIGGLIGAEREIAHRAAGMRTDMIVCVGSCVVMIVGQQIFAQYSLYGAAPDPTRLAAQVISGVGFLGAGTIMHEGVTVKGLTTAASLWAVACLGIAVGGGYYRVALVSTLCIFVILTILNRIQKVFLARYNNVFIYVVGCENGSDCLKEVTAMAAEEMGVVSNVHVTMKNKAFEAEFEVNFDGKNGEEQNREFFRKLCEAEGVKDIQCSGKFSQRDR